MNITIASATQNVRPNTNFTFTKSKIKNVDVTSTEILLLNHFVNFVNMLSFREDFSSILSKFHAFVAISFSTSVDDER